VSATLAASRPAIGTHVAKVQIVTSRGTHSTRPEPSLDLSACCEAASAAADRTSLRAFD